MTPHISLQREHSAVRPSRAPPYDSFQTLEAFPVLQKGRLWNPFLHLHVPFDCGLGLSVRLRKGLETVGNHSKRLSPRRPAACGLQKGSTDTVGHRMVRLACGG